MSDTENLTPAETLSVMKKRVADLYDELTGLRDKIDSYSKTKVTLIEKKYLAAKDVMSRFDKIRLNIYKANIKASSAEKYDVAKISKSFADLFDTIEIMFTDAYDVMKAAVPPPPISGGGSKVIPGPKLPHIQIQAFGGSVRDYSQFQRLFSCVYDKNPQLSDDAKAYYLHSLVTGEAKSLIKEFALDGAGYKSALDALHSRYGSKRAEAALHITDIFSFVPLKRATADSLRHYLAVHSEHVKALNNLGLPDLGDYLLFEICAKNVDNYTRKLFEQSLSVGQIPTHQSLIDFIGKQAQMLDLLESEKCDSTTQQPSCPSFPKVNKSRILHASVTPQNPVTSGHSRTRPQSGCPFCADSHRIYTCGKYLALSVNDRIDWVKSKPLCFSCLGNHLKTKCSSSKVCSHCQQKHHSSLHRGQPSIATSVESTSTAAVLSTQYAPSSKVLLGTLVGLISSPSVFEYEIRALVDSASQENLITADAARRLNLTIDRTASSSIIGISDSAASTIGRVAFLLRSRFNPQDFIPVVASVIPHITGHLPATTLDPHIVSQFKEVKLADSDFGTSRPVQLLLGAEIFRQIVVSGPDISRDPPHSHLFYTKFGALVVGDLSSLGSFGKPPPRRCLLARSTQFELNMERFWEVDTPPLTSPISAEDKFVEEHFAKNTSRLPDGRFQVALPFDEDSPPLGENRRQAYASFCSWEKRLLSKPQLHEKYVSVMETQKREGFIVPAVTRNSYVMTHHGVFKKGSDKLRVVYNASVKSDNGSSLNSTLLPGPKLQRDIRYVLLAFRLPCVAISADITAMFTQIALHPDSSRKLSIFTRSHPSDHVLEGNLTRLPFGLNCSPYLALKCLEVLADENSDSLTNASRVVSTSRYVDNFLFGHDNPSQANNLCKDVVNLLRRGQFFLSQYGSSHVEALAGISTETPSAQVSLTGDAAVKVLGLMWQPSEDILYFQVQAFSGALTKRSVLSYCSSIFDPLSLLNPAILPMKLFIQEMWRQQLTWDQPLPSTMAQQWKKIADKIPLLAEIKIPRHVYNSQATHWLAAFCDSSQHAYGCVIYLVSKERSYGKLTSNLLVAKSKVAPLKNKLTIPRLELESMLLLSKLIHWLKSGDLPMKLEDIYAYSDSLVCLAWLDTPPSRLNSFVSNRVTKILDLVPEVLWRWVPSKQNPADLASRGLPSDKFLTSELWFNGPQFLRSDFPSHSDERPLLDELPDLKVLLGTSTPVSPVQDRILLIMESVSNFTHLQRSFAYVLRFVKNSRLPKAERVTSPLSVSELETSLTLLVKKIQQSSFSQDIAKLLKGEPPSTSLLSLTPFSDQDGLLRVGGRLSQACLQFSAKHPIILPKQTPFTLLLCRFFHAKAGHAGPQLSLAIMRQKFWPITGRSVMKKVVHDCVICVRLNARRFRQPILGDLPASRTNPNPPFRGTVGVDAAGPFMVRNGARKTRQTNPSASKGYLLLFICLSTKAVHLEFMSSLTTEAFLSSFERMVSRRGAPSRCLSDQGGNFVKASKLISEYSRFLKDQEKVIFSSLATRSIHWDFNPVHSPDKGGIWERQIGVAKRLLKGLLGHEKSSFCFEEYSTMFAKVESLMNSRPYFPLCASGTDPLEYLSPAHFLTHAPFFPLPEPMMPEKISLHRRWDRVRSITQTFWKRWSREYLQNEITRNKWKRATPNLTVGQVVLVPNLTCHAAYWPLGVVEATQTGSQGAVRVVHVRTTNGVLRRSVNQLLIVPVHSDD